MMRLCLVVLAVTAAAVSAAAATADRNIRFVRQDPAAGIPGVTLFAPPPPPPTGPDDILPPPPPSEDLPPEILPPPPPIKPPPSPPPPPPPTPEFSHEVFEVEVGPGRDETFVPATPVDFAAAPAPAFALAPAPRRYVPFATYGPPASSTIRTFQQDDPNHEFNQISSDWNVPSSRARSLSSTRPLSLGQPNQEFSMISSDWGAPESRARSLPLSRSRFAPGTLSGAPHSQLHGRGRGQLEPNHEFNEISSEWGAPIGALAKAFERQQQQKQQQQQGLQNDEEEPLQEFNEISSDWGFPSSLVNAQGRRRHGHHHHHHHRQQQPSQHQPLPQPQPQPQPLPQPQPQPQPLPQPLPQPKPPALPVTVPPPLAPQQQNDPSRFEGRFVYSHLVDGLLFTGPHRDSPLDLATSPLVRLLGGSFSFVSPDGIPVNIKKIRYHSGDDFTQAVKTRAQTFGSG